MFENGQKCDVCSDGFFKINESLPCEKCINKFNNCKECYKYGCMKCDNGFVQGRVNCRPINEYIPHCVEADGNYCVKCEDNYHLFSSVNCLKNVTNCEEYNTKGCIKCKQGYRLNNTNCTLSGSGYINISIFILLFALLYV